MHQKNRQQSGRNYGGGDTHGQGGNSYQNPQVSGGCMFCVESMLDETLAGHQ